MGAVVGGPCAAASVLAKVSRDRLMVAMDAEHPGYGFAAHKGYCTAAHSSALAQRGPCSQHRSSFVNVARSAGVGEVVVEFAPEARYDEGWDKMEPCNGTVRREGSLT